MAQQRGTTEKERAAHELVKVAMRNEDSLLEVENEERRAKGRPALTRDEYLDARERQDDDAARRWAAFLNPDSRPVDAFFGFFARPGYPVMLHGRELIVPENKVGAGTPVTLNFYGPQDRASVKQGVRDGLRAWSETLGSPVMG
jgi:hypothetical protein